MPKKSKRLIVIIITYIIKSCSTFSESRLLNPFLLHSNDAKCDYIPMTTLYTLMYMHVDVWWPTVLDIFSTLDSVLVACM